MRVFGQNVFKYVNGPCVSSSLKTETKNRRLQDECLCGECCSLLKYFGIDDIGCNVTLGWNTENKCRLSKLKFQLLVNFFFNFKI